MQRIVIKLGTSSLTKGTRKLSLPQMVEFARQLALLHGGGHEVILVCSGAIAAGKELLPHLKLDETLPPKQMLASIGQVRLMQIWTELFGIYGTTISQILLTKNDFSDPKSYSNAQNTFLALLKHRIFPIVNENDTVATDEISLGDNDNLSSHVARLVGADLLVLLTDQEGLYTHDPRIHPDAKLIPEIEKVDAHILALATGSSHPEKLGTGGMATKLEAARVASEEGIATIISSALTPNVLLDIVAGKPVGTRFSPQRQRPKNPV